MIIILMGVAGCGKTTIGNLLQEKTGIEFIDGDKLHPAANVEKMKNGIPLDDTDRIPWFDIISQLIQDRIKRNEDLIIACSALKDKYRKILLKDESQVKFIYLDCTPETAESRIQKRVGHFMPSSLVQSQFETLEIPSVDEAFYVSCLLTPNEQVQAIINRFFGTGK